MCKKRKEALALLEDGKNRAVIIAARKQQTSLLCEYNFSVIFISISLIRASKMGHVQFEAVTQAKSSSITFFFDID